MGRMMLMFAGMVPVLLGASMEWRERIPKWEAGVSGGIPEVAVVCEIRAGALGSGGSGAIEAAIGKISGGGALLLPEGEFLLRSPVRLPDGVVLRGRGAGKTVLFFDIPPPEEDGSAVRPAYGAIRMEGRRERAGVALTGGHVKGSTRLEVAQGHGFRAGDLILVSSENDPELMFTDPRWDASWAPRSIAQIVTVTEAGERAVCIDTPLRLTYKAALDPRANRIEPVRRAGVEALTVRGADGFNDTLIGIEAALDCWVRNVETAYTGRGHIWINFSRRITVSGNECHHAHDYGGGGNGYGIVAGNVATDCLYENNLLHHLRHAMMAKRGSNGNVFAYNYSTEAIRWPVERGPIADISVHGHYSYQNLFEGNVVEFVELADYWGPTGPLTTLFRNRVRLFLQVQDHSHHTNVVGNELQQGVIEIDPSCKDVLLLANRDAEREPGPGDPDLPASLYRGRKPGFWDAGLPWPSIGPGTDPDREVVIPAQFRWRKPR